MRCWFISFFLVIGLCSSPLTYAQLRLPKLVASGMVLVHSQPIPIWGWASPGQKVTVYWQQKVAETVSNSAGEWRLELPPTAAGGPYSMRIVAERELMLQEIWVGEVWLCSGQSNMEQSMDGRLKYRYASYIQQANYPQIRQYLVPDTYHFQGPLDDLTGGVWLPALAPHISSFTAVGYFFALERWQKTGRPIGLINASLGGSPAEAWISEDSLKQYPDKWQELQQVKDSQWVAALEQRERTASAAWQQKLQASDMALGQSWQLKPADSSWKPQVMPAKLYAANGWPLPGVVWMKKTVQVKKLPHSGTAILELGRLVDADSVWINGRFLGHTTYQYPARRYEFSPTDFLKLGDNDITIRMVANNREGGMVADKRYELRMSGFSIDLQGRWLLKQSARMENPEPGSTTLRWKPAGLYNGMIAPLRQYGLTGVLWYQGESNAGRSGNYSMLMRTLIGNWRQQWQASSLPFFQVQLPAFLTPSDTVQEYSGWAAMRRQQAMVLEVPNTAMAGIFDLGEYNDVHPENKLDVGKRLAALAAAFFEQGDTAAGCGPLLNGWQRVKEGYELEFRFTGGALSTKGTGSVHLLGQTADGKWLRLKAKIRGQQLLIPTQPSGITLRQIRYDWADNPTGQKLCNAFGIPATPFVIPIVTKE